MTNSPDDRWLAGDAYEEYMGRWSRMVARRFLEWLRPRPSSHWLDVGCGTGALTSAICELGQPASVVACDPSPPFVEHARKHLVDPRVSFVVAGTDALPNRDEGFDLIVSGLMLNFVPDAVDAVTAMRERLGRGGSVAAYVWDYAGGMEFLRYFWDEAIAANPDAAALDEGRRFPLSDPGALAAAFRAARLQQVDTQAVEIATVFATFEDYWQPFLRGTGPAPGYVASLDEESRARLKERLTRRLAADDNGRIRLRARAWTVRGTVT